jgi:hypothetical protein
MKMQPRDECFSFCEACLSDVHRKFFWQVSRSLFFEKRAVSLAKKEAVRQHTHKPCCSLDTTATLSLTMNVLPCVWAVLVVLVLLNATTDAQMTDPCAVSNVNDVIRLAGQRCNSLRADQSCDDFCDPPLEDMYKFVFGLLSPPLLGFAFGLSRTLSLSNSLFLVVVRVLLVHTVVVFLASAVFLKMFHVCFSVVYFFRQGTRSIAPTHSTFSLPRETHAVCWNNARCPNFRLRCRRCSTSFWSSSRLITVIIWMGSSRTARRWTN